MLGFAISILGITWFSVATVIGSTLGDEWTFGIILSLAHMALGFMVTIIGINKIN